MKLTIFLVVAAAGAIASQCVYAQTVTNIDEFSYERLEQLEQRVEAGITGDSPEKVVENATGEVGSAESGASGAEKQGEAGGKLIDTLGGDDRSMGMWRSLGALLIVLGGLFVISKWVQGRMPGRIGGSSQNRMKVLERLTIDHRRQLVLVSAGSRELVIAVSPNEINAISEWPVANTSEKQDSAQPADREDNP
jgi:flagellar biogenesis protein FliO